MSDAGRRRALSTFAISHSTFHIPRGITLIEVLISMFVLLFGLMGVAAIFPVASHYVLEGDKRDRSSGLAQIAFEELRSRNYLNTKQWVYPTNSNATNPGMAFVNHFSGPTNNFFGNPFDPGVAFVIDPLASATPLTSSDQTPRTCFPFKANNNSNNPPVGWSTLRYPANPPISSTAMPVGTWPIKRITLDVNPHLTNNRVMTGQMAETAFRLRDDLITQHPDAGDRPSVQRWRRDGSGNMLAREFTGDYSWLATVVPTRQTALLGLQPAANYRDEFYEVTSVVFYKRDIMPSVTAGSSAGSERLISAEFLSSGELALYNNTGFVDTVDTALDGIKPTNWIAVSGVNRLTGAFMLKWYKILAMDDSTSKGEVLPIAGTRDARYLMVGGPEWPSGSYGNLRAIILPGAIDAYTQIMQLSGAFPSAEPMQYIPQ
jgi:type II secretory pathway pseudopilin PulG